MATLNRDESDNAAANKSTELSWKDTSSDIGASLVEMDDLEGTLCEKNEESVNSSSDGNSIKDAQHSALECIPISITLDHVSYWVPDSQSFVKRWKNKRQSTKESPSAEGSLVDLESLGRKRASIATVSTASLWSHYLIGKRKVLLQEFSGVIRPGELLAIMGGSGAGKTTLLDLLANRLSRKRIEGCVLFNGVPVTDDLCRQYTGYVWQEDALHENLTVRETLKYVNKMQFRNASDDRIEAVLEELGLCSCADTRVGGITFRGISGGERKRLSIAIELLANPSVLLLDEPTTGLDSCTSLNMVRTLKTLAAANNRTVVCTIHQPSSNVYRLFDKILLMGKGGKVVYFGQGGETAVKYFESIGFPCDKETNPADHFLDVINTFPKDLPCGRLEALVEAYQKSGMKEDNESLCSMSFSDSFEAYDEVMPKVQAVKRPLWPSKLWALLRRNFLEYRRNKFAVLFRLLQTILIAVLMGLTFFGVGAGVDQKAANDLRGVLFFMSIQQSMAGLLAIITLFHGWDRIVFKREHAGSLYSTELYMTSKLMAELPMQILSPILFSAITYWMVGLSPTLNQFLIFVACMVVTTLTGQSLGMVISVFTPTPEMAHVIAPVVIGLLLLSGGFFTSVETVPSWLKWTVQGNFVRYSNEIIAVNELVGVNFTCAEPAFKRPSKWDIFKFKVVNPFTPFPRPPANATLMPTCMFPNGTALLDALSFEEGRIVLDFGILLTFFVTFEIIAYLGLKFIVAKRIKH